MAFKKLREKIKEICKTPFIGYFRPEDNGKPPVVIPLIDIRNDNMAALIKGREKQTQDLVLKSRHTFGWISRILSPAAVPVTDGISRRWLGKSRNPYMQEIRDAAKIVDKQGVYTLNLCYEWGCTSGVHATNDTATMFRVLDWPLPLMGENLVVAHQKGTAGDFYNVTWPAYSGMLQGMAPGRFSAAINKAPVRRSRRNAMRDWFHNHFRVGRSRALPPPHLLRHVFEKAANFDEAKKMLMTAPVTMPAIFILAGTGKDQGCVIERTDDHGVAREMSKGRVVAANHFESSINGNGDAWKCRLGNGMQRSDYARTMPPEEVAEKNGFPWFANDAARKSEFANHFTRVVMTADAGAGTMRLMGTAGEKPVTEIFRIDPPKPQ